MKKAIIAALACVALSSPVLAQATVTKVPAAGTTITIKPEERTRIKQYVTTQKIKPVTVKERLTVGATVPSDVELLAVPSDWGADVADYRYVYSGSDVVLVDPTSRRVVQVID